jgi:hypothetical protein
MGQIGLWFGLVRMLTMVLDPGFCASFFGKMVCVGEWILVGMDWHKKVSLVWVSGNILPRAVRLAHYLSTLPRELLIT